MAEERDKGCPEAVTVALLRVVYASERAAMRQDACNGVLVPAGGQVAPCSDFGVNSSEFLSRGAPESLHEADEEAGKLRGGDPAALEALC